MQALFSQPIIDVRQSLNLLVDALSHPGRIAAVEGLLKTPHPLHASSAILCCACLTPGTRLWTDLDMDMPTVRWLMSVCGGRIVTVPSRADLALVTHPPRMPSLKHFASPMPRCPGRIPLLVIQTKGFAAGAGCRQNGAADGTEALRPLAVKGLPGDFWDQRDACLAARGGTPDLVFTHRNHIIAAPGRII